MNDGNWIRTLLFTLIGFGLGWAICASIGGRCCTSGTGACHPAMACMGDCKGMCAGECAGRCATGKKDCCKKGAQQDGQAAADSSSAN